MAISHNAILQVFFISLVVSTTSVTISETKPFEKMRRFLKDRCGWLGHLVGCPYCVSHYISGLLVLIYRPKIIEGFFLLDYIMTVFVVVALATFWSLVICICLSAIEDLGASKE